MSSPESVMIGGGEVVAEKITIQKDLPVLMS